MSFDYIRALDPPDDEERVPPLESILPVQRPLEVDETELDQLISSARPEVGERSNKGVVVTSRPPESRGPEKWPSFLGVSLSSARLELPSARLELPSAAESPSVAEAPPRGRASAGIVTMALALVATAVFGAFVILR